MDHGKITHKTKDEEPKKPNWIMDPIEVNPIWANTITSTPIVIGVVIAILTLMALMVVGA